MPASELHARAAKVREHRAVGDLYCAMEVEVKLLREIVAENARAWRMSPDHLPAPCYNAGVTAQRAVRELEIR